MTNGEREGVERTERKRSETDDEAGKFNFQVEKKRTKESVKTKGGKLSVSESA